VSDVFGHYIACPSSNFFFIPMIRNDGNLEVTIMLSGGRYGVPYRWV